MRQFLFSPGGGSAPVPESAFMAQCMTNLSSYAGQKLQAQLAKDKAVTKQVMASAGIAESALGASCANVCGQYAKISHMISWANRSPGFLSEPEHTQQMVYSHLPQPAMPGKAELDSCLPVAATMNWCPASGSGIGAGPSRIENPLDKIKVCATGGEALQQMNFSVADAAANCARPGIVDAADRIKAEHLCADDAAKVAKAAAEAANKTAAVYAGPVISAKPAVMTTGVGARP